MVLGVQTQVLVCNESKHYTLSYLPRVLLFLTLKQVYRNTPPPPALTHYTDFRVREQAHTWGMTRGAIILWGMLSKHTAVPADT